MRRIDVAERRVRLAVRHHLAPGARTDDVVQLAGDLVGLHSSDPATVHLAARGRMCDPDVTALERALYEDRTLVRVLCMRRTLFVVPRELVPLVYAACTRTIAARQHRRLEKMIQDSGISSRPASWLARASKAALLAVEARGEAFTREVVSDVPLLAKPLRVGAGTRFEATQSVGSRLLPQLAMDGRLVRGRPRGTWTSGQYRWVPTEAWLGVAVSPIDPGAAGAELLRHWLAAFGPATETDLRWWMGWTAREARAALAAVPHAAVDLDGASGFVLAGDLDHVEKPEPWAALLPGLDPTTMGWKERDWYLGANGSVLFDRNGNAGPTIWWDGRAVGGWSQRRDGEIVFRLLEDVGADAVRAVESEAARLAAWLGDVRLSPSFLPPFQRELAA